MNVESSTENGVLEAIGDGQDQAPDGVLVPESFQVDSAKTANWLVRKILEFRRYQQKVRAWADAEIHKAEQEENHLVQRFGGALEVWLRRALEEHDGRRRSISLPAGCVGLRVEPTRLVVSDENSLRVMTS
jgi:hypothetical protein